MRSLFIACTVFFVGCGSIPVVKEPPAAKKLEKRQVQQLHNTIERADAAYEEYTEEAITDSLAMLKEAIVIQPRADEAYWRLARCYYWLYDRTPKEDKKEQYAERGIQYAKKGIFSNPSSAPCRYYYAVHLGLYSKLYPLTSLNRIEEMIQAAEKAVELDPTFDHAGPHRLLGYVYLRAPERMGIGDLDLSLKHLAKAMEIAPDFAGNLLAQAEAYIEDALEEKARKLLRRILDEDEFVDHPHSLQKTRDKAKAMLGEISMN